MQGRDIRPHPFRGQKSTGQFPERDVRLGLHHLHEEGSVRHKLARRTGDASLRSRAQRGARP